MFKKVIGSAVALASAVVSGVASAAGPGSISDLTSSVSFSDVSAAVFSISGAVITLYVAWKGAKFVIRAVKGA